MNQKYFVKIGEIRISNGQSENLRVVALGSCVAVIFFAGKLKKAGVAHVALPDSQHIAFPEHKPNGYFADIAVKNLITMFTCLGVNNRKDLKIKLVGGSSIMDPAGTFDIGKRNILAIRKHLWNNGLGAIAEDVGKNYSRSISVNPENGEVTISSATKGTWKI